MSAPHGTVQLDNMRNARSNSRLKKSCRTDAPLGREALCTADPQLRVTRRLFQFSARLFKWCSSVAMSVMVADG
jgi:hypothetical protein